MVSNEYDEGDFMDEYDGCQPFDDDFFDENLALRMKGELFLVGQNGRLVKLVEDAGLVEELTRLLDGEGHAQDAAD